MKTKDEIYEVIYNTPTNKLDLYSMPYVDGVVDALKWVIESENDDGNGHVEKPFTDFDDKDS